jgi:hypothetical protein
MTAVKVGDRVRDAWLVFAGVVVGLGIVSATLGRFWSLIPLAVVLVGVIIKIGIRSGRSLVTPTHGSAS